MDVVLYSGMFIISLAVLLKASDWFVDSAERIGLSLGISPFVVGVTIVAFGTSLPELATSVASVIKGESEIVVGNVVGSNITNIALVLGLTAVFSKQIKLEYNIWHIDMPYLWASAFFLWICLKDGHFSTFEAVLFILGIFIFLAYSFKKEDKEKDAQRIQTNWRTYALLVIGGLLVWQGAKYTIIAITKLSEMAGVNPGIIAISAVALGTSLPEVVVSLKAAKKGKTSIAVGNVLGSNVFNTYVVMGVSAFFGKIEVPPGLNDFFLPLMLILTILFGIMSNNRKITNWEGTLLLLFYVLFLGHVLGEVI